jgi:hypothetical protein
MSNYKYNEFLESNRDYRHNWINGCVYNKPIEIEIVRAERKNIGKRGFRYEIELSNGAVGKFDTKRDIKFVYILCYEYNDFDNTNLLNRQDSFDRYSQKTNCRSTHGFKWINENGRVCHIAFVWDERTHIDRTPYKEMEVIGVAGGSYGRKDEWYLHAVRYSHINKVVTNFEAK